MREVKIATRMGRIAVEAEVETTVLMAVLMLHKAVHGPLVVAGVVRADRADVEGLARSCNPCQAGCHAEVRLAAVLPLALACRMRTPYCKTMATGRPSARRLCADESLAGDEPRFSRTPVSPPLPLSLVSLPRSKTSRRQWGRVLCLPAPAMRGARTRMRVRGSAALRTPMLTSTSMGMAMAATMTIPPLGGFNTPLGWPSTA